MVTPVFAGVLPFFNPTKVTTQNKSFYINANTFLADDPFTLKDLFAGIKTNAPHIRSGQNIALGDMRIDAGYNNKKYGYIGYIYREEVLIDTNQNTVELIYLATNQKNLPIGKHYNLDLSINAFKAQGIEYAKSFNLYHENKEIFNIGIGLEALQGSDMQHGTIHGNGIINSSKDYSFNLLANYNYTHNYLFNLKTYPYQSHRAVAYGYSSDLSIYLQKNNLSLLLLANDILGRLYWQNLPYSYIRLSSNNKVYDANGYVKYKPILNGINWYKNYTQTLLPKYRAQLSYKYTQYILTCGSDWINNIYMPYVSMGYTLDSNFSMGIGYETRFKSVAITSKYKNFIFKIDSDSLFQPSTLGVQISYSF